MFFHFHFHIHIRGIRSYSHVINASANGAHMYPWGLLLQLINSESHNSECTYSFCVLWLYHHHPAHILPLCFALSAFRSAPVGTIPMCFRHPAGPDCHTCSPDPLCAWLPGWLTAHHAKCLVMFVQGFSWHVGSKTRDLQSEDKHSL